MNDKEIYISGTHAGPRTSKPKYGEAEAFFVVEHTNGRASGRFYLRQARRKVTSYASGKKAVRYDGLMYELHPADELAGFVEKIGGAANFDVSEDFNIERHKPLPFIKYFDENEPTWEP